MFERHMTPFTELRLLEAIVAKKVTMSDVCWVMVGCGIQHYYIRG